MNRGAKPPLQYTKYVNGAVLYFVVSYPSRILRARLHGSRMGFLCDSRLADATSVPSSGDLAQ
jgi:hypothetical protein